MAIGLGKQSYVAYENVICYYLIGIPFGMILDFVFHLGIEVSTIYHENLLILFVCMKDINVLLACLNRS